MISVKLRPRAKQDLREIRARYAQHDAGSGERIIRELDAAFRMLDELPLSGRERAELFEGLRSLAKPPHVIFYTISPPDIIVVRVLHERVELDAQGF